VEEVIPMELKKDEHMFGRLNFVNFIMFFLKSFFFKSC